jgi:hypothetical protein
MNVSLSYSIAFLLLFAGLSCAVLHSYAHDDEFGGADRSNADFDNDLPKRTHRWRVLFFRNLDIKSFASLIAEEGTRTPYTREEFTGGPFQLFP